MTLRQFADGYFKPHVESTFAAKRQTHDYYLYRLESLMTFRSYVAKRRDLGMEVSTC
jgi:hypothetical protein